MTARDGERFECGPPHTEETDPWSEAMYGRVGSLGERDSIRGGAACRLLEPQDYAELCSWRYGAQQEIAPSAGRQRPVVMPSVSGVKPLKVPERHVPAFRALLRMQEDDFSNLLNTLDTADPSEPLSRLAESIHQGSALSVSGARSLLDAVMELAALRQRSLTSIDHMAARVVASPQFAEADDGCEDFTARIKYLLSSDVIRLYSKASSIGTKYERLYVNAQVLTDLRPLFNDEIADRPEPEAALLSHTVSLHFIGSDGKHDNFFVVFDDGDLENLKQVIDRAIRKADALRHKLYESGLIYMEFRGIDRAPQAHANV